MKTNKNSISIPPGYALALPLFIILLAIVLGSKSETKDKATVVKDSIEKQKKIMIPKTRSIYLTGSGGTDQSDSVLISKAVANTFNGAAPRESSVSK